ncbi:MAG: hypothetical protein Kow009_03140 [Spirochaetales bacterium]
MENSSGEKGKGDTDLRADIGLERGRRKVMKQTTGDAPVWGAGKETRRGAKEPSQGANEAGPSSPSALCPVVEHAFLLLGKKWVGLILHILSKKPLHFCELERALPAMSARILSQRLKELEEEGLVDRKVYTGNPVRVTYGLTERGTDLIPVLAAFAAWARKWGEGNHE